MFSPEPISPLPLAAIIAEAVALECALAREWFPQARHHARLIVLRAQGAGLLAVAACGLALLDALNAATSPSSEALGLAIRTLLHAIDSALESETCALSGETPR